MIGTRLITALKRSSIPSIYTRRVYQRSASTTGAGDTKSKPHEVQSIRQRLLTRIHAKVPSFLRPYTAKLVNAPVTHLTSFLILHEITAILPICGLAAVFHSTDWVPASLRESEWVTRGVGKFGNWFKKKGWLDEKEATTESGIFDGVVNVSRENRFRIVLELATAWAITKALLPFRLGLCFYATPWFARTVIESTKYRLGQLLTKSRL